MKLFLILLCVVYIYTDNGNLYKNHGKDWPGLCGTGSYQSPINIIEGSNTNNTGKLSITKKTI